MYNYICQEDKLSIFCGCSSMVELQPSKLITPVRFRSPAPLEIIELIIGSFFYTFIILGPIALSVFNTIFFSNNYLSSRNSSNFSFNSFFSITLLLMYSIISSFKLYHFICTINLSFSYNGL